MKAYETRLQQREEIAEGSMAFHFRKPPGFTFKPGQAIELIVGAPPDGSGERAGHAFSIVSAPFEDDLVIATRMRDSAYKRALKALPVGAPARIEGPFGSLTLHGDRARPAVFIAGGIGITPCMSILRQAAHDRLAQSLALIYANRRPEDAAFLDELLGLEERNGNFRLVATMTRMSTSARPWHGATGPIDRELLAAASPAWATAIHYLVGPPAMVEATRLTLNAAGIDDDAIRSEEFFGY